MKRLIQRTMKKLGYSLTRVNANKQSTMRDIDEPEFWDIYELCKPYTMTSVERMYALYCSVNYVLKNNIPGAFVECGVWRGGSAMLIAKMLVNRNQLHRQLFLYDTFEGMTAPTKEDVNVNGVEASEIFSRYEDDGNNPIKCVAGIDDVRANLALINYPQQHILYVKGTVETTIPGTIPEKDIALLRLDTDWYESTKHELIHLFPKLFTNGVLIIDDYGHWKGCKKAVDEYFSEHNIDMLLSRIDYTCRVGIKTPLKSAPHS